MTDFGELISIMKEYAELDEYVRSDLDKVLSDRADECDIISLIHIESWLEDVVSLLKDTYDSNSLVLLLDTARVNLNDVRNELPERG